MCMCVSVCVCVYACVCVKECHIFNLFRFFLIKCHNHFLLLSFYSQQSLFRGYHQCFKLELTKNFAGHIFISCPIQLHCPLSLCPRPPAFLPASLFRLHGAVVQLPFLVPLSENPPSERETVDSASKLTTGRDKGVEFLRRFLSALAVE